MEYKMLCVDIDGTLLPPDLKLTPAVKQAVARINFDKYIPVILVSSRPPQAMDFLQEELDIMRPMICMDGGMVVQEDEVLHTVTFPAHVARRVLSIAEQMSVDTLLFSGWKWFVREISETVALEAEITRSMPDVVDFEKLLDGMEANGSELHKIELVGNANQMPDVERALLADNPAGLDICISFPGYLEISPAAVNKATAIQQVCDLYGYDMSQVVAIGDNMNDISMLQSVGMGIAMGNAPDAVKAAANDVAPSNSEDGVAAAIDKYF